jgi:hypothetical protein
MCRFSLMILGFFIIFLIGLIITFDKRIINSIINIKICTVLLPFPFHYFVNTGFQQFLQFISRVNFVLIVIIYRCCIFTLR